MTACSSNRDIEKLIGHKSFRKPLISLTNPIPTSVANTNVLFIQENYILHFSFSTSTAMLALKGIQRSLDLFGSEKVCFWMARRSIHWYCHHLYLTHSTVPCTWIFLPVLMSSNERSIWRQKVSSPMDGISSKPSRLQSNKSGLYFVPFVKIWCQSECVFFSRQKTQIHFFLSDIFLHRHISSELAALTQIEFSIGVSGANVQRQMENTQLICSREKWSLFCSTATKTTVTMCDQNTWWGSFSFHYTFLSSVHFRSCRSNCHRTSYW